MSAVVSIGFRSAENLPLPENIGTREKGWRVIKIRLNIDVSVVSHDPGDVVLFAHVVERLVGVDGHVCRPVVIAPIHSDDDQTGQDSSNILLNGREEGCGQEAYL